MVSGDCSRSGCNRDAFAAVEDYRGDRITPCEECFLDVMEQLIGAECVEDCPDDEWYPDEDDE